MQKITDSIWKIKSDNNKKGYPKPVGLAFFVISLLNRQNQLTEDCIGS
jgi:hypothetical protein